ncbi:MAG: hypothetical protein Q4C03_04255 [bacterium]|nr:hypothetical protein [bacterium]
MHRTTHIGGIVVWHIIVILPPHFGHFLEATECVVVPISTFGSIVVPVTVVIVFFAFPPQGQDGIHGALTPPQTGHTHPCCGWLKI